jgi:RNase P subunit RPR2
MPFYKVIKCKYCSRMLKVYDTGDIATRKGERYRVLMVECPIHGIQYHWERITEVV